MDGERKSGVNQIDVNMIKRKYTVRRKEQVE